jgi:hypothetical protein
MARRRQTGRTCGNSLLKPGPRDRSRHPDPAAGVAELLLPCVNLCVIYEIPLTPEAVRH